MNTAQQQPGTMPPHYAAQTVVEQQSAREAEIDSVIEKEQARVDEAKAKEPELPMRDSTTETGGVSGQRLKAFIERTERLEEEKKGIADDIKDIYAEAKAVGFDTKTIRKIVRLRKMDKEKRNEEEELLELYKSAIGMD